MLWLLLWLKFNVDDDVDDDDDDEADVLFAFTIDDVPFDVAAKNKRIWIIIIFFGFILNELKSVCQEKQKTKEIFLQLLGEGACEFDIINSCCCWIRCAIIADETGRSISPNLSECKISGVCFICAWSSSSFGNANCNSCI